MKKCTKCNLSKEESHFSAHKIGKDGLHSWCKDCFAIYYRLNKQRATERVLINKLLYPEKYKEQKRKGYIKDRENILIGKTIPWYKKYPDRKKESDKKYSYQNREKIIKNRAEWRERNKEKVNEYARAYSKINPATKSVHTAKRRAVKRQAYAKWANKFIIDEIYKLATLRTKITGIKWEVDHVIPLSNKLVCGLHVENNLQVIPAILNKRKSNKFII